MSELPVPPLAPQPVRRTKSRKWPLWLRAVHYLLAWLVLLGIIGLVLVWIRLPTPAEVVVHPRHPAWDVGTGLVWAHQGASAYAPSNTLPAFDEAVRLGADVLETDLHMSADGVVVLSHDASVDRLTDGRGRIADLRLEQLKSLDAGAHFVGCDGECYKGRGVQIPTLWEMLERFAPISNGRLRFSLELKATDPALAQATLEAIERFGIEARVVVTSFDQEALENFRALSGGRIATAAATREAVGMLALQTLGLESRWQGQSPLIALFPRVGPIEVITRPLANLLQRRNVRLVAMTINDEAEMQRLLELGVRDIITDYPDRALKVMQTLGRR